MKFALIKDSKVFNIIEADDDFISSIVNEYEAAINVENISSVFIGQEYVNNEFVQPPQPEVVIPVDPPVGTTLSKLKFNQRFTFEELVAIETAADSDPGIRVFKTQLALAEYIDLTEPGTIAGVSYLVSKNLLTQERADIILTP
jgi:hypothetical protein